MCPNSLCLSMSSWSSSAFDVSESAIDQCQISMVAFFFKNILEMNHVQISLHSTAFPLRFLMFFFSSFRICNCILLLVVCLFSPDIDECTQSAGILCTFRCVNVPGSYQCACPEQGYTMAANGRTCRGKEELKELKGVCRDGLILRMI